MIAGQLLCVSALLSGAGLVVEVPTIGVLTGTASRSSVGAGYAVGGGLAYELDERWNIRAFVRGGETFGGVSVVSAVGADGTAQNEASAQFFEFATGLGATLAPRGGAGRWRPFLGLDLGIALAGFNYHFAEGEGGLLAGEARCLDASACPSVESDTGRWTPTGGLRTGLRFVLADWLSADMELCANYMRFDAVQLSNTIETRNARGPSENVFLFRALFTARIGVPS